MKPLKFIHITKTGGTSIENTGNNSNIQWGRFHKEYGWWHEYFPKKSKILKDKYDWFTVVRNPYDRIVSEFYCKFTKIKYKQTKDKKTFNNLIQDKIRYRSNTGDHWSEQYKYIDSKYNIHIIKYENLVVEFNELMIKYNYKIELNQHDNQSKKYFSTNDLSRDTLDLINNIYNKDFELFNYKQL